MVTLRTQMFELFRSNVVVQRAPGFTDIFRPAEKASTEKAVLCEKGIVLW